MENLSIIYTIILPAIASPTWGRPHWGSPHAEARRRGGAEDAKGRKKVIFYRITPSFERIMKKARQKPCLTLLRLPVTFALLLIKCSLYPRRSDKPCRPFSSSYLRLVACRFPHRLPCMRYLNRCPVLHWKLL